ncbi:MAG TPA: type II toxin-antitoxin system HicA family toxin [Pseudomonas sp.]|uniref:type II toxin-antitoxin system HicA family toxin n=1 Tax=Pseudomonas sp. TaxID=306 RepID=UPI002B4A60E8|nr:type II toxin-antitoxin system HicA family toxin [Pseudomonas sp.]HKS12438.1 type II toxin-antitoxin system HicA family toxin [Pseudomonas sp.]
MSYNEFKRWLISQGVQFTKSKGRHIWKITYNGNQTVFPDHGAKEMKEPTRKGIIKQLGLK